MMMESKENSKIELQSCEVKIENELKSHSTNTLEAEEDKINKRKANITQTNGFRNISVILLIMQTVCSIVLIRISRIMKLQPGVVQYSIKSFVLTAEIFKVILSIFLLSIEIGAGNVPSVIYHQVVRKPQDTFALSVPAVLYVVQNNLIVVALDNMSAPLYQVTYQIKIISTAIFSVLLLGKLLSAKKWIALFFLTFGVALVSIPPEITHFDTQLFGMHQASGNHILGFSAVIAACITSGFSGVYLEKKLKGGEKKSQSIWLQNFQLAVFSCLLSGISCLKDSQQIQQSGFFRGYNWATWMSVLLQSFGGLIIAAVVKYADNIVKCLANATAIVLSGIVSMQLSDFTPSTFFFTGSIIVVLSTYWYLSLKR